VLMRALVGGRRSAGIAISSFEQVLGHSGRVGQGEQVTAGQHVGLDAQSLFGHPALEIGREEPVVGADEGADRNIGPGRERARLREADIGFRPLIRLAFGCDMWWNVVQEIGREVELSVAPGFGGPTLCGLRADVAPPLARGSPGVGIIALIKTSSRTEIRSHTSGAVKPPIDWATRTTSGAPAAAATTMSAYSASPADSSSPGRSTAITSWPAVSSNGTTRLQYQAVPPAPGISTNFMTSVPADGSGNPAHQPR